MSPADRAFRRYRRTGDPAAAGAVFDATAADLLRLAMHLLRDADAAEDAVQETFVSVLDDAASFDGSKRFLPWATGILVNRCRRALTERSRSRATQPLEPEATEHPAAGPDQSASQSEWRHRFGIALAEIPQPYRSAVELRLVDELEPSAIADRLRRSPSTVRSQLQRGIEHLRRGLSKQHLPLAATLPLPALDGLRARVLDRVPNSAGSQVAVQASSILSSRIAAAGLVSVFALVIATAWFPWGGSTAARPTPSRSADARTTDTLADASINSPAPATRRSPLPVSPRPPELAPEMTWISGRCLAAESNGALPGCTIRVESRKTARAPREETPPALPPPTETDSEGRFGIALGVDGAYEVTLHIEAEGRVPWSVRWHAPLGHLGYEPATILTPGTDKDLGDLAIRLGTHELPLRAVDRTGQPIAGVHFLLRTGQSARDGRPLETSWRHATSDAAGRLRGSTAFAEVRHTLTLNGRSHLAIDMPEHVVPSDSATSVRDVVLAARPRLSGRLADERGTPVRSTLRARDPNRGTELGTATTNASGAFALLANDPDARTATLEFAPDSPWQLADPQQVLAFGSTVAATVQVRRRDEQPPLLHVRAVDAASGEPVTGFSARLGIPSDSRRMTPVPERIGLRATADARGIATLQIPQPGTASLWITPNTARYAATGGMAIELAATDRHLTIELQPHREHVVQVLRPNGDPLVGAWVELLRVGSADPLPPGAVPDARAREAGHEPARLDGRYSDADGRAALQFAANLPAERLAVRAWHPRFQMAAQSVGPGLTTIQLVPPAGVRVFLQSAGTLGDSPLSLQARRVGQDSYRFNVRTTHRQPVGNFELLGLAPGTWRLELVRYAPGPLGNLQPSALDPPLGQVVLGSSEVVELTVDGSAWHPATVRGRAVLEGAAAVPLEGGHVWLERPTRHGAGLVAIELLNERFGHAPLTANGEFRIDAVPPGTWTLKLRTDRGTVRAAQATLTVGPGDDRQGVFVFPDDSCRIRVLGPDDLPYANQMVILFCDGQLRPGFTKTDDSGTAAFQLPRSTSSIEIRSLDQSARSSEVAATELRTQRQPTVRLR